MEKDTIGSEMRGLLSRYETMIQVIATGVPEIVDQEFIANQKDGLKQLVELSIKADATINERQERCERSFSEEVSRKRVDIVLDDFEKLKAFGVVKFSINRLIKKHRKSDV